MQCTGELVWKFSGLINESLYLHGRCKWCAVLNRLLLEFVGFVPNILTFLALYHFTVRQITLKNYSVFNYWIETLYQPTWHHIPEDGSHKSDVTKPISLKQNLHHFLSTCKSACKGPQNCVQLCFLLWYLKMHAMQNGT